MARTEGLLKVHALFYLPQDFSEEWTKSALWKKAQAIPGVEVSSDLDGHDAKLFGARTSGQALLYAAASNKLVFSGGITRARGHAGDNIGQESIISWVRRGFADVSESPVYGCHLFKQD
jgi:hypothetical protein